MTEVRKLGHGVIGLAMAAMLGACGGDSGPNLATDINDGQAQIIGQAAATQIGALASGLATFSSPAVAGLEGGFFAPQTTTGRFFLHNLGRLHPSAGPALAVLARLETCAPTISDSTDTDGDGIRDNSTAAFTAGNCSVYDSLTATTITITGAINVQDTDDFDTQFGYNVGFSGFEVTFSDTVAQTADIAIGISGTFGADVTLLTATGTQDVRTRLDIGNTTVFADDATWTVAYAPTTGNIDPANPTLPAGDFTVDGAYSFSGDVGQGSAAWAFGVNTTSPLNYDGTCQDPNWPFESGTLDVFISARQTVGFTVTYAGCGLPGTIAAYDNSTP
jgi:hypothetical protein